MKKIYFILAIAGIMMTTACSNENNEPAALDEGNVTFTVNLDGIDSRTISDGNTVDQLVFAVYDSNGNEIVNKRLNDVHIDNLQATITTRLQIGRSYTCVFWAQKKKDDNSLNDNGYYNTSNLKDVVVNYEGYANDESRDAFTAVEQITVGTKEVNRLIVLTRPFAQVDYVCDITEWENLVNSNYKLLGSNLVVDAGAYTHYNALTGEATQPTTTPITFALSDYWRTHQLTSYNFCGFVSSKPGDDYQDTFTTTDGDKFWLSMNYILATPEETNLGHTSMNIYAWGSEGPTPVEVALDEIPIKRNHRTVVYVSELTRIVKAVITIDPNFWGDF